MGVEGAVGMEEWVEDIISDINCHCILFFFFFNDTATTEIYTLSLHDALPISISHCGSAPLFILPSSRCGSASFFY